MINISKAMRKRVYNTWYGMLYRQTCKGRGRGRFVDPEWVASFEAFLAEVGPPKDSRQVLCLRDPDAGFYPGNVYWGTRRELQQYVSHVHTIEFNGQRLSISEAARRLGIDRSSLNERLQRAAENKRIGQQIQRLRLKKNLSIGELARLCQLAPEVLSEIETGHKAAGRQRLALIADVLRSNHVTCKAKKERSVC
jgi:hypothetical protein